MDLDHLLVLLLVGLVAGFLASHVMTGRGYGLVGDIIIGIVGAFIGGWLATHVFGIAVGSLVAEIIVAFIGAVVLLFLLRLFAGGRYGRRRML
ncbi:MAG TPA: GlsB/YeaQ/YmgE family stress response membrane protein [Candidatus Dormibacteraeota bacterium]